jgi:hypothetical protein
MATGLDSTTTTQKHMITITIKIQENTDGGLTVYLEPTEADCTPREKPALLPLSPEAGKIFEDFYNELGDIIYQADPRMAAQWSKLIGAAPRLALIGQLAHDDSDAEEISGDIMQRACTLARWFGNEADRIFSKLAETVDQREMRLFIEFVQRRGGVATIRDAMQNYRALRNDRKKAEQQFNATVKAGLASWESIPTTPKGGKPTRQIRLISGTSGASGLRNPMLHEGKTGFVDVDSKDK